MSSDRLNDLRSRAKFHHEQERKLHVEIMQLEIKQACEKYGVELGDVVIWTHPLQKNLRFIVDEIRPMGCRKCWISGRRWKMDGSGWTKAAYNLRDEWTIESAKEGE